MNNSTLSDSYKQQMEDSDMIFKQITSACYDNIQDATRAIVMIYVPDMTISRAGISHALKRIEDHFKK